MNRIEETKTKNLKKFINKLIQLPLLEKALLALLVLNVLLTIVFGFTFGVFMVFMASLALLIWQLLRKRKDSSKLFKGMYRIVSVGIITWIVSFVLIMGIVLTTVTYDVGEKEYDYAVVLGAGLWGDRISLVLRKRLEKTVELADTIPDMQIIVSGGQGEDELISEAEAMKRYLVEHGIEESRVILEDKSRNTSENFDFSKAVLDEANALELSIHDEEPSVLVVTSDFHLFRALRLAEKKGMTVDGVASETPMSVYLNYLAREYLAVIKSEVFD